MKSRMNKRRAAELAKRIPPTNQITGFIHCKLCITSLPVGQSPQSYARLGVGFTPAGLQVWCERHNVNVVHIDFEGRQHPANLDRVDGKADDDGTTQA